MFGYRYDTETGMYYLQSRYYNPEWGRFINADGIIGQSGELLGHNIFVYCKNNQVNMSDNNGDRPEYSSGITGHESEEEREDSCAKMYKCNHKKAKQIKKSTNNKTSTKSASRKKGSTDAIGISASVEGGIRFAITVQIVYDSNHNVGLIICPSGGGGTLGFGITGTYTHTDAYSIYDLRGLGMDAGGSIGTPLSFGSDYVSSPSGVSGFNLNAGGKGQWPIEMHTDITYTWIPLHN